MNQQILTNNETDQTKGEAELESLLFEDLNLTDEQLAEIKGGPGGWGRPTCDDNNHNETTVEDDADLLDDLMLDTARADDIKAGCPGCGWGPPMTQHNETVLDAGEADGQAHLADLPVADEQAEEIKSGTLSSVEYTLTVTDTQTGKIR